MAEVILGHILNIQEEHLETKGLSPRLPENFDALLAAALQQNTEWRETLERARTVSADVGELGGSLYNALDAIVQQRISVPPRAPSPEPPAEAAPLLVESPSPPPIEDLAPPPETAAPADEPGATETPVEPEGRWNFILRRLPARKPRNALSKEQEAPLADSYWRRNADVESHPRFGRNGGMGVYGARAHFNWHGRKEGRLWEL